MNGRIEIKSDGYNTKVFVNGEEIRDVRSIQFEHEAGSVPTAKIELLRKVDIDEIADITIEDELLYAECRHIIRKKLSSSIDERQRWLDCIE